MHNRVTTAALAGLLTLLLGAPGAQAIQPAADAGVTPAKSAAKTPARPFVQPSLDALPSLRLKAQNDPLLQSRIAPFQARYGGTWEVRWDDRSDRPNVVQGSGVPLIPGRGNSLQPQAFGVARETDLKLDTVAAKAREFIDSAPELLQADGIELQLDGARSVVMGGDRPVWFIEFGQFHQGVRVDGAFYYVRIAQGNVVQFGAERVAPVTVDTQPALPREAAFKQAWDELAFPLDAKVREFVQQGELRLYPNLTDGSAVGEAYNGMKGAGYGHVLAWRYVFRLENDDATWQVLVDAHTNRVIEARDLTVNLDAKVSGGIFPTTSSDVEVVVDFPYTAVTDNGAAEVTSALGIYDYSGAGNTANTALNGKYFRMVDTCGTISLNNTTDGNLALGTSAGTDCITPGIGGAGNTHSSRSGFYHLTKINEKARTFFTTNTWLQGKVTANMNLNQTCNAYWDGSTLNFFKSGGGCSNTGEIAAVFLHEWGHGMDTNSGGAASENGSGEAVGDTFAFLETRDSCIGQNFKPGVDCANCVQCTGVRDVADFGVSAAAEKRASPANLGNNAGINCDRYACPYTTPQGQPYRGPMGYEGHCESYIASGSNWDLTQALIAKFGNAGWGKMDRIWYSSLTPSKSAYRVASGGQCNVAASVDGCAATNWYTVYLAADDDDGNLANGTPNACRIYDAFAAHGIACGTERPVCSGDEPDFSITTSTPSLAVCAPAVATFNLALRSDLGFTNPVTLAGSGNPSGTTVAFPTNPVTPANPAAAATATVTTAGAAAGTSTLTFNGTATGSPGHATTAQLTIATAAPGAPTLSAPADNATGVDSGVALTWTAVPGASSYTLELATDSDFTTIVTTQSNITTTSWTANGLTPTTRYWWRVRADGVCGAGANPTAFSFTTSNSYCVSPNAAIPDANTAGVSSNLTFTNATVASGLKLKIKTTHTYIGDLSFTLSRGATSVVVIDRPGVPASTNGCDKPNIDVVLDDEATTTAESSCSATSPALGGTRKPNNPMDTAFGGSAFGGTWTLKAVDAAGGDTGTVTQWCLEPKVAAPPQTYAIGGTVSGMTGTGLTLKLNAGADFVVNANGGFTFPTQLATGANYTVTIAQQPTNPTDVCTLAGATGTVGTGPVSVTVTCVDRLFGDGFDPVTP